MKYVFVIILMSVAAFSQTEIALANPVAPASCPANNTNGPMLCSTTDPVSPLYISSGSGVAFVPLTQAAAGVTSFNTRTGKVTAQSGDYAYNEIASPPTTVTCTTFAINSSGGITLSGCVIK